MRVGGGGVFQRLTEPLSKDDSRETNGEEKETKVEQICLAQDVFISFSEAFA